MLARKLGAKSALPSHYRCLVKRDCDPEAWAALTPAGGAKPPAIPCNSNLTCLWSFFTMDWDPNLRAVRPSQQHCRTGRDEI